VSNRALLRAACAIAAVLCLGIAASLAFDWADYGSDSTCGNLIHYKDAGPPCSDIMRNRVIGVVALGTGSIALLVVVAWPRRSSSTPT
jgi:hypothetical protein